MIHIVDYGVGNLESIKNMLHRAGFKSLITSKEELLAEADKIILPGVGAYSHAMEQIKASGLIDVLNKKVIDEKVPTLGICLGSQLLFEGSEEGDAKGLGWIKGTVVKFNKQEMSEDFRIPNMGWCETEVVGNSYILDDMPKDSRFYFAHSYHFSCNDQEDELMKSHHGYSFVSAVSHGNIVGVQFHPEKSHKFGMCLLSNFAKH